MDKTDPKLRLLQKDLSASYSQLEQKFYEHDHAIKSNREWLVEHDKILRGSGIKNPGLISHIVSVESKLVSLLDRLDARKKVENTILASVILLLISSLYKVITG